MYQIYTDGAISFNGKANQTGGWAFVVVKDNEMIYEESGQIENATNNICEMTAVINACDYAEHHFIISQLSNIEIISDSSYITNAKNQGWLSNWIRNNWITASKTPVKNKELWQKLIPYFNNDQFNFVYVKGHAGNHWNERADQLAVAAKEKAK